MTREAVLWQYRYQRRGEVSAWRDCERGDHDRIQRTGVDAYGNPAETRELFDTPPGPHAMTAQAGAVGYIRDDGLQVLNEGRLNIALWASPSYGVSTPVYLAPPAAVPVEALEGLVAGLEDSIAHNDESDDWLRGAKTTAQFIRDELTQLIKERSNGR